jgi:hypothetical protein
LSFQLLVRASHTLFPADAAYHGRDAARLPDVRTHDTTSRDTAVFDVTCRSSALAQASSIFESLCGLGLSQPSSSTSRGQPCNSRSPVPRATSWAFVANPRMTSPARMYTHTSRATPRATKTPPQSTPTGSPPTKRTMPPDS